MIKTKITDFHDKDCDCKSPAKIIQIMTVMVIDSSVNGDCCFQTAL